MKFDSFTITVTTAGTQVRVATTPERVKAMLAQARPGNTGTYVYLGRSDVDTADGWTHKKGTAPIVINCGDGSLALSDFWVDSDTNGDKVEFFVLLE